MDFSKLAIGLEQLANQFAKGDRHARRDVFDFAERFGIDLLAGQATKVEADRQATSAQDEALLSDYLSRYQTRMGQPDDEVDRNALSPTVQKDSAVEADPIQNDRDRKAR